MTPALRPLPLTDEALLAELAVIAARELRYQGPLTPETPLVSALNLDSIRLLSLVMAVENHFQVALDEGDEQGIETVGDLLRLIRSRRG